MATSTSAALVSALATMLAACASGPDARCPELSGTYHARTEGGLDLANVFGLATTAKTVTLTSSPAELSVVAGAARRTLVVGRDYQCTEQGLSLTAPRTGGYDVPGVLAEHVDRYYTFSMGADASLIAHATDRTRVRFIGPELTSRGVEGPNAQWRRAAAR